MKLVLITAALSLAHLASAQESAKSLFVDPMSGVSFPSSKSASGHRTGNVSAPQTPSSLHNIDLKPVTGLSYWIELQTPSGQLLRVPASRQFKTGERIRIHVESNVDGQLSIMQSEDGGPFAPLFPAKLGMDNHVQHLQDKILPSPTGWFRFDSNPGSIRLLLMVQANGSMIDQTAPNALPAPGNSTVAANNVSERAQQMQAKAEQVQGSKALFVDQGTPEEPVTYAVVDARKSTEVPPGMIAIEMRLTHSNQ
jgi:hypothetical protein